MFSLKDFGAFSNDKWAPGDPGNFPSLESIHDSIHVWVGGPMPARRPAPAGHMSDVPYAAFDPVFWLHHW
jgi:tyrosinase